MSRCCEPFMRQATVRSTCIIVFTAVMVFVCSVAAPAEPADGVVMFDTTVGETGRADSGYPTMAVAVSDDYLWVGRSGGFRRYDRHTGEWVFYRYTAKCPGRGTVSLIPEKNYIWARLSNTGTVCRFDRNDESWYSLDHWTVTEHLGPGSGFIPTDETLFVACTGGPDWEGVSLIDRDSGEWIKLLKTKPVSAIHLQDGLLWLGVPAGILTIEWLSEEYRYFQPGEHGGGALIKDIVEIPGGLAFATLGDRTSIIGDRMKIDKDSIHVYMKKTDSWYTYGKRDRDNIINDLQSGKIAVTHIETHPGLLIRRDGRWRLLTKDDGLETNDVQSLAVDDNFLYAGTLAGITVFKLDTLKPVVINRHISLSMRLARKLVVDEDYMWVVSQRGLFRVDKKRLFSSPRVSNDK